MKLNKIRNLLPMLFMLLVLNTQLHADYNVIEYKPGQNKGIFYPEGKKNSPIVFFLEGDFVSSHSRDYNNLMKFIAKQGYTVMFAAPHSRIGTDFKNVDAFIKERKEFLDTSRIGIVGHSTGGGLAFYALSRAIAKGWGNNGRFIFAMEPWLTYNMTAEEMHKLHNTNVMILHGINSGDDVSFRVSLAQYYSLDSISTKHKAYQLINNKNFKHNDYKKPVNEIPYIVNPLKALMKYTFKEPNNESLRQTSLGKGDSDPYRAHKQDFIKSINNDTRNGNKRKCKSADDQIYNKINHCSDYMPPFEAYNQHKFSISNRINKKESHYYLISASEGDTVKTLLQSTNGDSNVYVGVGYRPRSTKNDCHSTNSGTNSDSCDVTLDNDAKVYVRVYGRKITDYNLEVTKNTKDSVGEHVVSTSNRINKKESHYYLISASEGDTVNTLLQSTNGDSNVYVGVGYRPRSTKNDCHSTNSGTNSDSCDVTLDKDATVYVRVYGRKTTDYNLEITKSE